MKAQQLRTLIISKASLVDVQTALDLLRSGAGLTAGQSGTVAYDSIANLEHHHFKYDLFRRAGDVHVHFFGTATLSFADGVQTREGDVFEISATPFTLPVRNALTRAAPAPVAVKAL